MRYRFANCVLDVERMLLRRDGDTVAVEPQVFSLLVYLLENRGRVVSKVELLDAVWGDQFVSESALTSRISSARAAIGDDGTRQELLRTVHRRGYELVVSVVEEIDGSPGPGAEPERRTLPAAPTELIGREVELAQVRALLEDHRLVSITGPGGIGKTRLAIAAGEAELARRGDGVVMVELATVADGSKLVTGIGSTLGLLLGADPVEVLLDYLQRSDVLLIMDNCEHLVAEVAALLEQILARQGSSVILTTTRERFDVAGEHLLPLQPLRHDDDASPAVRLFEARAAALDPSFAVDDDNRLAVSELCRRLDGVPLAIELAAARTSVLSPAELLGAIDDRLELFRSSRRPERHRTLMATLDWSYQLLDRAEQQALARLGVFTGSFDAQAAAAVSGLTLPETWVVLESLIGKSLVVRRTVAGTSRFSLLETTAAYAVERLGEARLESTTRHRHLDHYLAAADNHVAAAYADLAARATMDPDRPNLVRALDHAAEHGRWEDAAQLLIRAGAVWYDNPTGGSALIERCLPHLSGQTALRLLLHQAFLHLLSGDAVALRSAITRLVQSADPLYEAYGLAVQGFITARLGEGDGWSDVERALRVVADLPPDRDQQQAEATCHALAGLVMLLGEDFAAARSHADTAVGLHDGLGFESEMLARALVTQAVCALVAGDDQSALDLAGRYARSMSGLGTGDEIKTLAHLGLGRPEEARVTAAAHARRAVTGTVARQATDSLLLLVAIDVADGDVDAARDLLTSLGQCRQTELTAYSWHLADRLDVRRDLATNGLLTQQEIDIMARRDVDRLRLEVERRHWLHGDPSPPR